MSCRSERSSKVFHIQTAAFNDAFEGANRDHFAAVHRYDNLSPVGVSPLLMTAGLAEELKVVPAQHANDFVWHCKLETAGSWNREFQNP